MCGVWYHAIKSPSPTVVIDTDICIAGLRLAQTGLLAGKGYFEGKENVEQCL